MTNDPAIAKLLSLADDDAFWEKRNAEVAELRKKEAEEMSAVMKAVVEKQWRSIPEVYRELFDPSRSTLSREAVEHCKTWSPDSGLGIGLLGTTGMGKTRLLCAVLRRFRYSLDWLYLPAFEMSNAVANQWSDDQWTAMDASRILRLAKRVSILLLDDLADERSTDASASYFKELVEHRTSRKLPILWSSNVTKEELAKRHGIKGDATVRRLIDYSTIF